MGTSTGSTPRARGDITSFFARTAAPSPAAAAEAEAEAAADEDTDME